MTFRSIESVGDFLFLGMLLLVIPPSSFEEEMLHQRHWFME